MKFILIVLAGAVAVSGAAIPHPEGIDISKNLAPVSEHDGAHITTKAMMLPPPPMGFFLRHGWCGAPFCYPPCGKHSQHGRGVDGEVEEDSDPQEEHIAKRHAITGD
ncbi:hypothetical protein GQ43DRAFT_444803, partial [Delitschia confertaspora ATCC 74209]